jgi:hypothetical protein
LLLVSQLRTRRCTKRRTRQATSAKPRQACKTVAGCAHAAPPLLQRWRAPALALHRQKRRPDPRSVQYGAYLMNWGSCVARGALVATVVPRTTFDLPIFPSLRGGSNRHGMERRAPAGRDASQVAAQAPRPTRMAQREPREGPASSRVSIFQADSGPCCCAGYGQHGRRHGTELGTGARALFPPYASDARGR